MRGLAIALAGLFLLGACGSDEGSAPPIDPLPVAQPDLLDEVEEVEELPEPTETQAQMHDRYDAVTAIRTSLVRGDVEGARVLARGIGPVTGELPELAAEMRGLAPRRAAALARASDPETAGRAFGALLEGCGRCHAAGAATWTFETPTQPDGEDPATHMRRHEWAVDRMWEGLLVRDIERFDMGAAALADAPLGEGSEVAPLAERVHARAAEAAGAESMEARAAIFGDVVAACAECHRHFATLETARVR